MKWHPGCVAAGYVTETVKLVLMGNALVRECGLSRNRRNPGVASCKAVVAALRAYGWCRGTESSTKGLTGI